MSQRELQVPSPRPAPWKHRAVRLGALWLAAATAIGLANSCTTPQDPNRGATIKKVAGDAQTFIVGRALPETIVVKISGKGLAGQFVSFTVTKGGGSIKPAVGAPDANGLVKTEWTLGPNPGSETMVAFAPGQLLTFTATASEPSAEFANDLILQGTLPAEPKVNDAVTTSVMVVDVEGAPVAGATVVFTVTQGGGTVNGQITDNVVTDESGLAGIQPWHLGTVAGTNTLSAESVVDTGTVTRFLTVVTTSLATADRLGIRTAPADGLSGVAFATAPVIEIRDSLENVLSAGPGSAATIRAGIASGPVGARLVGKITAKAVHGVATFDSLSVFGPPGVYQLKFTATTGLTPTQSGDINVAVGPPSWFTSTVAVLPTALVVGGGPASVTITVRDDYGNPVSGVQARILSADSLADLIIQPNLSDQAGQAVGSLTPGGPFSTDVITGDIGQRISRSATLSVRALGGSLSFVVQPPPFSQVRVIGPAPQVVALDATGAVLTAFAGQVTAGSPFLDPNSRLSGTTTVTAVNGVTTFKNLRVLGDGNIDGYHGVTLTVSSPGLLEDQSTPFEWFATDQHFVVVSGLGTGNGRITFAGGACDIVAGTPYGLCVATLGSTALGTDQVLSARPANGSVFVGWSGACTGVGSCTLPHTRNWNVTATFR